MTARGRFRAGRALQQLAHLRRRDHLALAREALVVVVDVREPVQVVHHHPGRLRDALGGGVGQTIGYVEGREAAQPFEVPPPIDAINAALVDEIFYNPFSK